MSAQNRGACETLTARVTRVRPLARVRAHVTLKIARPRETLACEHTGEFFSALHSTDDQRAADADEGLTAGLAAVGFVSAVAELVFEELPLHVEGFAALLARELLLCAVRLLVLLQVAEVTEA